MISYILLYSYYVYGFGKILIFLVCAVVAFFVFGFSAIRNFNVRLAVRASIEKLRKGELDAASFFTGYRTVFQEKLIGIRPAGKFDDLCNDRFSFGNYMLIACAELNYKTYALGVVQTRLKSYMPNSTSEYVSVDLLEECYVHIAITTAGEFIFQMKLPKENSEKAGAAAFCKAIFDQISSQPANENSSAKMR